MHTFKMISFSLALMLIFVSMPRAEEISREQLIQLNKEGRQALNIADYFTAIEKWEQGLNLAYKAKKQQFIGDFISNLGVVYRNLDQYLKALDYSQQALTIKEIGDKRGEGNDLGNIGIVYYGIDPRLYVCWHLPCRRHFMVSEFILG